MLKKYRMKQVYDAVQAVEGEISSLPGVYRDVDKQTWMIRTAFGISPLEPDQWLVWLVNKKLILMSDEEFKETFEEVRDKAMDKARDKALKISKDDYDDYDEVHCHWFDCPNCEGDVIFLSNFCSTCGVKLEWDKDTKKYFMGKRNTWT